MLRAVWAALLVALAGVACGSSRGLLVNAPASPGVPRRESRLVAGNHATCLVGERGAITCWGPLPHQVADVARVARTDFGPAPLPEAPGAASVVVGEELCVVDRGGAVRCLDATGTFEVKDFPAPLRTLTAKAHQPFALTRDGAVLRLGPGGWTPVGGLEGRVADVVAGIVHTCVLRDDGRVLCLGKGEAGFLGDSTCKDRDEPTLVAGLDEVVQLSTRKLHTCALRADGRVFCWGLGDDGQLGDGVARGRDGFSATPVEVRGLDDVSAIAVGGSSSCALRRGRVLCWGSGETLVPALIPGLEHVTEIAVGGGHACALTEHRDVWCWGIAWWGPAAPLRPVVGTPTRIELP